MWKLAHGDVIVFWFKRERESHVLWKAAIKTQFKIANIFHSVTTAEAWERVRKAKAFEEEENSRWKKNIYSDEKFPSHIA